MSDTTPPGDESGPLDAAVWGSVDDETSFGFLKLAEPTPEPPRRKRRQGPRAPDFNVPGLLDHAPAADDTPYRLRLDSAVRGQHDTWSDWEEAQLGHLNLFARMARTCMRPAAPPAKRAFALRWYFGHTLSDGPLRTSFAQTCHVLEVRPFVMRAAMQQHLFRRAVILDAPLSENARLHSSLVDEAGKHGLGGRWIADSVWQFPSRTITEVIAAAETEGFDDADETIAALVNDGLLGLAAGRVWFTARAPILLASRHVSFAKTFLADQDESTFLDGGPDVLTPEEREIMFGTEGSPP